MYLDKWHQDDKVLLNRTGNVGLDDNYYNKCVAK